MDIICSQTASYEQMWCHVNLYAVRGVFIWLHQVHQVISCFVSEFLYMRTHDEILSAVIWRHTTKGDVMWICVPSEDFKRFYDMVSSGFGSAELTWCINIVPLVIYVKYIYWIRLKLFIFVWCSSTKLLLSGIIPFFLVVLVSSRRCWLVTIYVYIRGIWFHGILSAVKTTSYDNLLFHVNLCAVRGLHKIVFCFIDFIISCQVVSSYVMW
jgi:hypothetical protein